MHSESQDIFSSPKDSFKAQLGPPQNLLCHAAPEADLKKVQSLFILSSSVGVWRRRMWFDCAACHNANLSDGVAYTF